MVQIHTVSSGFSSGFTLPRIKDIVLIGNRHIGMLPKWPPGPFLWPLHGGDMGMRLFVEANQTAT